MKSAGRKLTRVAYLTGEYPKVSHTFILREAEALREHGIEVHTCSIREPGSENLTGPEERSARDTTFYVLAVYFGAIGVKDTRHALPACLIADLTGILAALFGVDELGD